MTDYERKLQRIQENLAEAKRLLDEACSLSHETGSGKIHFIGMDYDSGTGFSEPELDRWNSSNCYADEWITSSC